MKYCVKCGKELIVEAVICTGCGCSTDYNTNDTKAAAEQDKFNFGFAAIGFLVPLVGLILYIIYHEKTPLKAKSAGIGAIVGVVANIVFSFLFSFFYSLFVGAIMEAIFGTLI